MPPEAELGRPEQMEQRHLLAECLSKRPKISLLRFTFEPVQEHIGPSAPPYWALQQGCAI
jgi:hypothetical protein